MLFLAHGRRLRVWPEKLASPDVLNEMNEETAKTKTIVFIEDNPVVLLAYRNRLEREGFRIEPAKDGLAAMKLLSQMVPDVVILDLMLPKFNGSEVIKFIQVTPRLNPVCVIVLSTNSILEASEEYLLERASKRLLKSSCTPSILLQAVRELLATPSAKDASSATQPDTSQPAEQKEGNVLAGVHLAA